MITSNIEFSEEDLALLQPVEVLRMISMMAKFGKMLVKMRLTMISLKKYFLVNTLVEVIIKLDLEEDQHLLMLF